MFNYDDQETAPNLVVDIKKDDGGDEQNLTQNNNNNPPNDYSDGIQNPEEHDMKASIAAVLGNVLEWYDFAIFGYLSDIIGEVFFPPNQEGNRALIQSFAVFGAAFLVRPIGSIMIGIIGDTVGRKSALETSIFFMAIPTFALGCLPSFASVGWFSTLLLIIVRILQGFSVGGQLMSSVVFTMERNDRSKWGRWGASVFAFSSIGIALGSLFSYVIRETLNDEQLRVWGWRIPFWFGALGALPGLYLKLHARESGPPGSDDDQQQQSGERNVLKESFSKSNCRALISCILICALPAAAYYTVFVWLVMFMEKMVDPPVPHAFAINAGLTFFGPFLSYGGGFAADFHGNYVNLMYFSAVNLAWSFPVLLHFVGKGDPFVAASSQAFLGILLALWTGAMLPWIVASFPPSVRLTSVSFAYNLSTGIFGGFSPAIATALVDRYDSTAPGLFVTVLAVLAMLGLYIAPKSETERSKDTGDIQFADVNQLDHSEQSEHEMT